MQKKVASFKPKGMNRDLSVSAFNPEFVFENRNLRLSTNDGNTMLSWVNEKGTLKLSVLNGRVMQDSLPGCPIGTAVVDDSLILFTTEPGVTGGDHIYEIKATPDSNFCTKYPLYDGNLGFDISYPIETLVSVESDTIKKVYWTDGKNQPRVINIATPYDKRNWTDTSFDFVTSFNDGRIDVVKKAEGSGMFSPGVIQYCFTYYNKYGQQTNVADVSPLFYITHSNRGASPEDKVANTFTVTVNYVDYSFDYIRIYAVQRSSLNGTPFVRLLTDLPIRLDVNDYSFVDDGTRGSTVDPYELLFAGGHAIKALTMADKDGTLFLGNISKDTSDVQQIQSYFDDIRENGGINGTNRARFEIGSGFSGKKTLTTIVTSDTYSHQFTLKQNNQEVTTFKCGNTYRLGFQLQKFTGEWTEPIFMDDVENTNFPTTELDYGITTTHLPYAKATIDLQGILENTSLYKSVRPVIVYPTIADKKVLCQGVLNPTVFNSVDRIDSSPYAQASWFFRPYTTNTATSDVGLGGSLLPKQGEPAPVDSSFSGNTTFKYVALVTFIERDKPLIIDESASEEVAKGVLKAGRLIGYYNEEILINGAPFTEIHAVPVDIWGAIKTSNKDEYILLLDQPLRPDNTPELYYYDVDVQGDSGSESFEIYKGVKHGDNILLYYQGAFTLPRTYVFEFSLQLKGTTQTYALTFGNSTGIKVKDVDDASLSFMHYSPLANRENTSAPKHIEIQNASNLFGTPFKDKNEVTIRHNTEFFIDQSIVTLNSPDIDFNMEMQSVDTEGLKLRVVGAIPITANACAHHISATSMLGVNSTFGFGESDLNIRHTNALDGTGRSWRLVTAPLWDDTFIVKKGSTYKGEGQHRQYRVYPWQRQGSLNNDWRAESTKEGEEGASAVLKKKVESTILYSFYTGYLHDPNAFVNFKNISAQIHLQENEHLINYRLARQKGTTSPINYYPNIDKVLYTEVPYSVSPLGGTFGAVVQEEQENKVNSPVSMKYKSGSHAVIALGEQTFTRNGVETTAIPILPYGTIDGNSIGMYRNEGEADTFWGDSEVEFGQDEITSEALPCISQDYLWLGELYRNSVVPFGGKGEDSVKNSTWQIGGKAVDLIDGQATIYWTEGDTYYQRYDCLKTYPFTKDDQNQLVEILSFMCESFTNLDGRYDRNRGLEDNTNVNPTNFNLLNPAYNQTDNFFTSKKVDTDSGQYFNQITWTGSKESGADVDLWTNITLASALELDGDKGRVTKLTRLNNGLFAFQERGFSQILYNENTQITTTNGVPIEIANSGKVQGKRYISDTVGCSNKWSLVNTPSGIYFMDNNDKSIYLFNGQLQNLSASGGMNSWCKQNMPDSSLQWDSLDFGGRYNDLSGFTACYDKPNQDVLFINKNIALAYSEKFNTFTSFYDYGNSPYLNIIKDTGIWLRGAVENGDYKTTLWRHQGGDYSQFFGKSKPFNMTLVGNPEPQVDKMFTNLEFRACVDGEGEMSAGQRYQPYLPFDKVEAWNEYQKGVTTLSNKNQHGMGLHGGNDSALIRKFRMWRCDIPRNNVGMGGFDPWDESFDSTFHYIKSPFRHPNDRMRNPWIYLKLSKENPIAKKVEIHDIVMTYFS